MASRSLLRLALVAIGLGLVVISLLALRGSARINVIIIAVDALRADRLGCYGAEDALSPAIDSLAAQGVIFLNATTQAPATGPSFTTLMTSRYPLVHGVVTSAFSLPGSQLTLAEVLRDAGYQTVAFPGNAALVPQLGLNQGFELYDSRADTDDPLLDAEEINDHLLPWLESHARKPFFVFAHYMEPHAPYRFHDPDSPYTIPGQYLKAIFEERRELDQNELARIRAAYDSEVSFVDQHIKQVLNKLDEIGVRDRTMIVFLADHGELLYEHEYGFGHYDFLYQEVVRVPLILSFPPFLPHGKKVDAIVESRDVAPTILDLLGLPMPDPFDGTSLLGLIRGEGEDDFGTAYTMREPWPWLRGGPAHALRVGNWKYIYFENDPDLLFDLASDPKEQTNLLEQRPDVAKALKQRLIALIDEQRRDSRQYRLDRIPPDVLERLRSLGYAK